MDRLIWKSGCGWSVTDADLIFISFRNTLVIDWIIFFDKLYTVRLGAEGVAPEAPRILTSSMLSLSGSAMHIPQRTMEIRASLETENNGLWKHKSQVCWQASQEQKKLQRRKWNETKQIHTSSEWILTVLFLMWWDADFMLSCRVPSNQVQSEWRLGSSGLDKLHWDRKVWTSEI